jgi:ribosomal protein S18 acetylase RimI-like enzyme
MEQLAEELIIRSLGDCTINEMTDLWNRGFQNYYIDMTTTPERVVARLGKRSIHPECSVTGWIDGEPAGFVMIGIRRVRGEMLAWNGGSGVTPAFRGRSLSKVLLLEAMRRTRAEGAETIVLETRTENEPAIRAYRSCGFDIVDTLHDLRRSGSFETIPFRRDDRAEYVAVDVTPEQAGRLPFYCRDRMSWTTQWFNTGDSRATLAIDDAGEVAGYANYKRSLDDRGRLQGVELTHCEAKPGRSDRREVVRFLLGRVMGPPEADIVRFAHYIRAGNTEAIEALREAGFAVTLSEYLMAARL